MREQILYCWMLHAIGTTILDILNEKLRPPLPPHFNDGKMARFALRANSSLILGGGGGGV